MTLKIAGTPPEHNRNQSFRFLHQNWVKKAHLTPGLTLTMTLAVGSETQAYMAVLPFCTGWFSQLFSRLLFPLSFTNFHRIVAGFSYPVFIVGMAYSLGFSPITFKNETL
ncbi:hypothetical protein U0033_06135 [Chitinophaga sancti]|uniref:Uncharacterized protein n=1 Tax=Chitinophaga sancti TaxID=1004 RepID=A0A1K1T0Z8_9BACT|nr:hypothetical protein [Chitinophaga sancti]WQD63969.1 hypothetical protein U0033_06135 [Chitinophaga sancti]WQG90406.1 hypothetical protein SR876_02785 [Chitinophaga sancti]SFW90272.1 hypothetical protein SAMN05661012_06579 [Chitinophaga sancti]